MGLEISPRRASFPALAVVSVVLGATVACSGSSETERDFGAPSAPDPMEMTPTAGESGAPSSPLPPERVIPGGGVGSDPPASCKVDELTESFELPICELKAAPDSFSPVLQWSVELGNGFGPPLVANLTDDNGDGEIDLCDTPDVIVMAGFEPPNIFEGRLLPEGAELYVLDGATGEVHFTAETKVSPQIIPAVGDIDGDGLPDIVATGWLLDQFFEGEQLTGLVAFDHTGKVKWQVPLDLTNFIDQQAALGIALHDLDGDGQVEIIIGGAVFEGATGMLKWNVSSGTLNLAALAVDLDLDGTLELVTGLAAFDSQGNELWNRLDLIQGNGLLADIINLVGVYPLVVDLDDDPYPEILLAAGPGVYVLEHDGSTKLDADGNPLTYQSQMQGLDFGDFKPPTAHDFDGDGEVDIALGAANGFVVLDRNLQPIFEYPMDNRGFTATTAFDFLGDGYAEAIYGTREELLFFDVHAQRVVMTWPHSGTMDYPVVADVDNDGSAEVIVVSSGTVDTSLILPFWVEKTAPTVQVLADAEARWVPTRRIWNMSNYHVTHVREDATIPSRQPPHYRWPNTFRTNVQLEAGGVCETIAAPQ